MSVWKIGLVIGACAACCAPLIVPLLAGASFAGLGAAGAGYVGSIEATIVVLALGVAGLWLYWRRAQVLRKSDCGCAEETGCKAGNSCDLPGKPLATQTGE